MTVATLVAMTRSVFGGAIAFAMALPAFAVAQQATGNAPASSQLLPVDPAVKVGTLPNGVRYYIRRNGKPEKRAELRLIVNAGSILEDDDQKGMAHFIEHTAFNGTTHFKKNDLINYLESIGVRFGADLNAYTGFDETVYILPIPTDTARIVEAGFQILEDWAHGQLFDSTEVMNERGVVVEEWRGRKGASDRMMQQWLPVVLRNSRYAVRLPIGTQESIESATPSVLRRFYRDWYRPDLMAVVAVGDFDPAAIEALIKTHFGGIPGATNPRVRTNTDVPANQAPLVAITTDKEATGTNIDLSFKLPHETVRTVGDYRRSVVEGLYLGMLNSRLYEIGQQPDAPFLSAVVSKGSFYARSVDAFTLNADVKDGGIERGLQALLVEARRVDQFGFLESELAREKQDMLRSYERAFVERDKTNSGSFVSEYIGNYLNGEAIPGIAYEFQLMQQLIPTITLADVNTLARRWITDENRVILATAPQTSGVPVPAVDDLLAVFGRANAAPVTAYTETLSDAPLLATLPKAGTVTGTRTIASAGVTEWTLSNGARVLVKPTDFKADEVRFTASSLGGTSLVPDADFMSATFAAQIAGISGIGTFNSVDLGKKLSGKVAGVGASITSTTETLSGGASPRDLETLFQLIYLTFTAPRLDTAAWEATKNQIGPYLDNRGADPSSVFEDTVSVTMSQHHFRARPPTMAVFNEIDPVKALAIYKDRFAEAGDFTFVFVGNVVLDSLKPLVERYIASLPTIGRTEKWKDVGDAAPKGVVERTVRKGTDPKANTLMLFTGPFTYAPETRFAIRALVDVFQIKLNQTLREQLGGTYSPAVSGGGGRIPRQEYTIQVEYESAPENVEKLSATVLALIDSLKATGPSAEDVEKVREQYVRGRETDLETNAYWLGNILSRDQAGEDIAGLLAPYDAMIAKMTASQIQAAARLYFNTSNYAKFILLPER